MFRFLFASTAITAHTYNPLPIAAQLVERGHEVDWYASRAFHDRIRAQGARPFAYTDAHDFGAAPLWESFPALANRRGPLQIARTYADVFVGQAGARVSDLRRILAERPAQGMLCDGLMFGVDLVHELGGPPWATYGDTPLTYAEADTPPFGAGLLPMSGPLGRLRNRVVSGAVSRVMFARAQRVQQRTRAALGLRPARQAALPCVTSPYLHLQACTPSFEYPRAQLPEQIHWIGALHPDPTQTWRPPPFWHELDGSRPVVHVTQGTLRSDPRELIVPTLRALADLDVLVIVTSGDAQEADIVAAVGGKLPLNARVASFVPYDRLLACAQVFVTNGGYTGVTLALRHGVPIVQAGASEEKAEIGARIAWSGVGVRLGRSQPSPAAVRAAVLRVLQQPRFAEAAARVQREMLAHHASREAADRLEQLALTRQLVPRNPVSRLASKPNMNDHTTACVAARTERST